MTDNAKPHNRFVSFTQGLLIDALCIIAYLIGASADASFPWNVLMTPLVWLMWIPTLALCWICGVPIRKTIARSN